MLRAARFDADTGMVRFRGEGWKMWAGDGQAGTVLKAYREHLVSTDASTYAHAAIRNDGYESIKPKVVFSAVVRAITRFAAAAAPTPRRGQLSFGWASESITPDKPVAVGGQYHTRISGQVHDPLTATALAIETRDANGAVDQAVMVSCDLSLIRRQTQEKVRELVKTQGEAA